MKNTTATETQTFNASEYTRLIRETTAACYAGKISSDERDARGKMLMDMARQDRVVLEMVRKGLLAAAGPETFTPAEAR